MLRLSQKLAELFDELYEKQVHDRLKRLFLLHPSLAITASCICCFQKCRCMYASASMGKSPCMLPAEIQGWEQLAPPTTHRSEDKVKFA